MVTVKSLTRNTSYTSIFTMTFWTEIISPNSQTDASWTVNKPCLRPSTQKIIQKDGASSTTKVSIKEWHRTCICANNVQIMYESLVIVHWMYTNPRWAQHLHIIFTKATYTCISLPHIKSTSTATTLAFHKHSYYISISQAQLLLY